MGYRGAFVGLIVLTDVGFGALGEGEKSVLVLMIRIVVESSQLA